MSDSCLEVNKEIAATNESAGTETVKADAGKKETESETETEICNANDSAKMAASSDDRPVMEKESEEEKEVTQVGDKKAICQDVVKDTQEMDMETGEVSKERVVETTAAEAETKVELTETKAGEALQTTAAEGEKPMEPSAEVAAARSLPKEELKDTASSALKVSLDKSTTSCTHNTVPTSEDSSSAKDASSPQTTNTSASVPPQDYAEHVTYTPEGKAIYTDPQTKYRYEWCTSSNSWTPCESQNVPSTSSSICSSSTEQTNPYENEHYKWCAKTQKWLPKATQVTETEHYKWDASKQQWLPKVQEPSGAADIVYGVDEQGQRIYTDKDGTVYFWDADKNAWFPKIDEDFMARYQMSYGFIDNTSEAEKEKQQREQDEVKRKQLELEKLTQEAKTSDEAAKATGAAGAAVKRKAPQEPPKWFELDPTRNTKVYVSNLPLDITLDEFAEVMGKCGLIMRDPATQKFKLKLYTEADGQIKGDGLCDYIKVESVELALNILDEYNLRGHKLSVQRAQFQMRGEYNPALKPKKKKKDKEKLAKIKEKLFDWRPEKMRGERSKHEKSVIIKNLFQPETFEKEVQLILDYQNDLREECSKCGTVRKVIIYDRHSEGVAQVNMASPEEADMVIQMMHRRFFGQRQLTAEHWDGKTKYKIEETEEEIQKRLNKWDQYLETDEQKSAKSLAEEETDDTKAKLSSLEDE